MEYHWSLTPHRACRNIPMSGAQDGQEMRRPPTTCWSQAGKRHSGHNSQFGLDTKSAEHQHNRNGNRAQGVGAWTEAKCPACPERRWQRWRWSYSRWEPRWLSIWICVTTVAMLGKPQARTGCVCAIRQGTTRKLGCGATPATVDVFDAVNGRWGSAETSMKLVATIDGQPTGSLVST